MVDVPLRLVGCYQTTEIRGIRKRNVFFAPFGERCNVVLCIRSLFVCLLHCTMQPFSLQKASVHEKKRHSSLREVSRNCTVAATSFIIRERIYDALSRVSDAVVSSYDLHYRTQYFDVSYTEI